MSHLVDWVELQAATDLPHLINKTFKMFDGAYQRQLARSDD